MGRDICLVICNSELLPLVILEEWHKINFKGEITVKDISVLDNESNSYLLKKLIKFQHL